MPFNLNDFKARGLKLGGARPTLFSVDIFFPFTTAMGDRVKFFCRAASIPPAPLDTVPVPYFGRKVQYSGDRDFPPWTVTCYNDDDWGLRTAMEKWSNMMNLFVSNVMAPEAYPTNYKKTAVVTQYKKNGELLSQYEFVGMFPTNVDAITLDWDQTNTIEQFDVTFAYDWWQPQVVGGQPDQWSPTLASEGQQS